MTESVLLNGMQAGEGRIAPDAGSCLVRAIQDLEEAEHAVRSGSAAGLFLAVGHLDLVVEACRNFGKDTLPSSDRQLDSERMTAIRTRLRRISTLMAQSAEFHAGWARLAGMRASAYGPDGSELGLPAGSASGSRCDASG